MKKDKQKLKLVLRNSKMSMPKDLTHPNVGVYYRTEKNNSNSNNELSILLACNVKKHKKHYYCIRSEHILYYYAKETQILRIKAFTRNPLLTRNLECQSIV